MISGRLETMHLQEMRYVALAEEFGGTPMDWERQRESKLQVYTAILDGIVRKRRMEKEKQEAILRAKGM